MALPDEPLTTDIRDMAFAVERLRVSAVSAGAERLALAFELALHETGAEMGRRGLPFTHERTQVSLRSPAPGLVQAPSR